MSRDTKIAVLAAIVIGALVLSFRLGMRYEYNRLERFSKLPPAVSLRQGEAMRVLPNQPAPGVLK